MEVWGRAGEGRKRGGGDTGEKSRSDGVEIVVRLGRCTRKARNRGYQPETAGFTGTPAWGNTCRGVLGSWKETYKRSPYLSAVKINRQVKHLFVAMAW